MAENLLDTILGFAKRTSKEPNPPKIMPQPDRAPTKENAWKQDRQKGWLREPIGPAIEFLSSLAGGVGTALSTYSPDAQGMIRKGGRTDLNMVHNIGDSLENFLSLIRGRNAISSPSIAISRDSVHPFANTPTLLMNPSSPLYDPAQNTVNQLINRDMYATRAKTASHRETPVGWNQNYETGGVVLDKSYAQPSTLTLRQGRDARFTEGGGPPESSQTAAIMASPRFTSLAEYENSKYGAKTLVDRLSGRNIAEESETVAEAYKGFLTDHMPFNIGDPGLVSNSVRNPENMQFLKSRAASGDKEARHLLDMLRSIPSDYAELKVVGEVPMTPRDISALIIPADKATLSNRPDALDFAHKTGIRMGTPAELMPANMESTYENLSTSILKMIKGVTEDGYLGQKQYNSLPDTAKRYVPSYVARNAADKAVSGEDAEGYILKQIKGGQQYEADVASMLTAEDADVTSKILKLLQEKSQ